MDVVNFLLPISYRSCILHFISIILPSSAAVPYGKDWFLIRSPTELELSPFALRESETDRQTDRQRCSGIITSLGKKTEVLRP